MKYLIFLCLVACNPVQGVDGERGLQGPRGLTGLAGASATPWTPTIYTITTQVEPTDEIQVLCDQGSWLVTGGCVADADGRVIAATPQGSAGYPDRMVCGGLHLVTATAVCMVGTVEVEAER